MVFCYSRLNGLRHLALSYHLVNTIIVIVFVIFASILY